MKAVVDQDLCVGCGMCEGTCPAVFSMNEEGQAQAIAGEIPEGELSLRQKMQRIPVPLVPFP